MAGETEKYLARIAQDRIPSSEEWQRRAMRILETGRAYDEQESVPSIWPGNTFNTVPVKLKPDNWLYNTLSNPKLNRGLETLAGNAADVILGRESGNALVDLGTSNIPGIGAASILAAGGMPGLVDAVGAGELRNIKKIPKYTYEFVKEFFGDRGLKNLDNTLTKYPKAEKPSVNDALYLMRTGMGGEKVNAIKPYSTNDVTLDLDMSIGSYPGRYKETMKELYSNVISQIKNNDDARKLADDGYRLFEEGVDKNDIKKITSARAILVHMDNLLEDGMLNKIAIRKLNDMFLLHTPPVGKSLNISAAKEDNPEAYNNLRRIVALADEPIQDWETIARKQELKDARDLEKQARKQAKAAKTEQPKAEQPLPENTAPEAQETQKGGPNMWRENGWDPNVKGDAFYGKFGSNLSEESKRDMFVLDSLANHWARQIVGEGKAGKLTDADIVDALDRAEARHSRSNYNAVSQGFYDDLKKNIASGNMPGRAVEFGPKYRKNVITNRDTPTLVLDPSEKPRFYNDIRIWADEQEGPDLYEMVFRPKSDEILNSINPAYWLYRK